ncbi:MAG: hypothetical protein HC837_09355 [Chloroflexaceae bacterium]|nr:hypothetical protein [Chloroflexaceae bacterium]
MKIAAVTDNGTTISSHFGRAKQFVIITVEDGQIVNQELRQKEACGHGHDKHHHSHQSNQVVMVGDPGTVVAQPAESASHDHHDDVIDVIADCTVVLARGMGHGMYARLQASSVKPVLTTVAPIQTAVIAYLEGRLKDHPELVH